MYIFYVLQIMASHMKCGSCGFKSDDSSRWIRAWGGGGFFRVAYLKMPRQVDVEICVYLKKAVDLFA